MDGCGWNSNSSEILRLSWIPVSLMMIRSKMKLSCPQHLLHYKSMGEKIDAQGHVHVTLNQIVWSGQKVNSSEVLCLSSLKVWRKSDQELWHYRGDNIFSIKGLWEKSSALKGELHKSVEKFFGPPNWPIQSGQDSNSSEILCLPWFTANLKTNR